MRETLFWTYPWDLADEGVGPALGTMQERAGATGVCVASVYHAGKFLHVHNPRRRVVFPASGTLYFRPDSSWYGRLRIQPPVWPGLNEHGLWAELRREADRRDLSLTSWLLCLHNSGIGFAYPDCAVENAYGDSIPTDLCASSPDVRRYLVAVAGDIAEHLHVDRILLESLEYMPFRHGYHHEVVGVPTGPVVDFLLSLCFCPSCAGAAAAAGVALERVRAWVRETLDGHFADPFASRVELSWAELRDCAGGELGGLLDLRQDSLALLLEEVTEAIRAVSSARIGICDFGPLYPLGPDGRAWENGVDLERHLPLVDEIHPTFYFTEQAVHERKRDEYLAVLGGERPMLPAIRAILPQTDSEERLREQVEALAPHAVGFSFYNYGFMALPSLDWVGAVVRGLAPR